MSELIIDKITTRDGSNVGAIVVADIDELLLLNTNKEINTTAIVKDSNRGGVFNYDGAQSGVNNGGTVFNGWVRQYDGAVNVKWFGAVGDGITDDYSALVSAVGSVPASTEASFIFPNGTYLISETLEFGNRVLVIDGGNSTIKLTSNSNGYVLKFTNSAIVSNLRVTQTAGLTSDGIFIAGIRHRFDNIQSFNAKFTKVFHLQNCKESHFSNIRVDADASGKTGSVFYMDYSVNNTISDSMIGYCEHGFEFSTATEPTYGYKSEGFTATNVVTVYCDRAFEALSVTSLGIVNCVLDFNESYGVFCTNGGQLFVSDSWIAMTNGSTGACIGGHANFTDVKVHNNSLIGGGSSTTARAISAGGTYTSFVGNYIQNLNFGIVNDSSSYSALNKQTTGTTNAGNAKGLDFNNGELSFDVAKVSKIDSTGNTFDLGKAKHFSNKTVGTGSNLVYSQLGDVPTFGEVYVSEAGTNNYLILKFYKQGSAYSPRVTTVANLNLTFAASNAGGTIAISGYTDIANCTFSTEFTTTR